jgi:dTDP-4-amino-4,6-dideoxygalactose transaminase
LKKAIYFNSVRSNDNYGNDIQSLLNDYNKIRSKEFSQKCKQLLSQNYFPDSEFFLTHSATGALEMVALLLDIQPGDEVIMPSFTYVSSASPFALRGAKYKFVDINPHTMNMDTDLVEKAISPKTKAIVCMHYGGFPCEMNRLNALSQKYNIALIEDAAMGFGVKYENQFLGSIGDFGVISFDVTKQITAIQGGLLIVNKKVKQTIERAHNIYHIGTNRKSFANGNVPYFEWVDLGSKFQLPELGAVILYHQLLEADAILEKRKSLSLKYWNAFQSNKELLEIETMSEQQMQQNYLHFYILLKDKNERDSLSDFLKSEHIESFFHYIPLHSSDFGLKNGEFIGENNYTKQQSERLLRLPLHNEISEKDIDRVVSLIQKWKLSNR